MDDYRFYIGHITMGVDDASEVFSAPVDLESGFPGLRYKKMTGLNDYGSPRVHSETFVEEDYADVFVPESGQREQTDMTLSLCFFDPQENVADKSDEAQYEAAQTCYHSFVSFISGGHVYYYDTARNRKVRMYLSSSSSPKTDALYGVPYLEVEFKFKNVYGRSFPMDDETIPIPGVNDAQEESDGSDAPNEE